MTKLMKYAEIVAGLLLGFVFIQASVMVLFGLVEKPPIPPESAIGKFTAAFSGGYMTMVKVLELIGGVLVAIPFTRNLGLLVLGPIIVNILAFHQFVAKVDYPDGPGVFDPMLLGIAALALFLLWAERRAFVGLVCRPRPQQPAA